jgi:hypothetical protein
MIGREVDALQQHRDALAPFGGCSNALDRQRLGDSGADRQARIERCARILKDHLRFAAHWPHFHRRQACDRHAIDDDLAREGNEAEHNLSGCRLARAAFADETERALVQLEADAFDCRRERLASAEPGGCAAIGHAKIMNEENRVGRRCDGRRGGHARRAVRSGEGAEARHSSWWVRNHAQRRTAPAPVGRIL